jgi:MFS family permease
MPSANHGIRFWASVRALPRSFRRFLVGVGVFGAGDFSHTLLILAATQLLTGNHGAVTAAQIAAILYALRNVLYMAASYPVGTLSDRFNRRSLLVLGYLLGMAVMVGFVVVFLAGTSSILWLGVLLSLAGVYIAVEDALEGVLTADLVPEESIRGTAYGVMGTVNGVGDFLSSAVVGLLWSFNPAAGGDRRNNLVQIQVCEELGRFPPIDESVVLGFVE